MSFVNLAALKAYINAYITTNGTGAITGSIMNTALLGITEFIFQDSVLMASLATNANSLQDNRLIGASWVKVYSGVRLIDNGIALRDLGISFPDGFTFDPNTGTVNFASTRGAGETYIIEYLQGYPNSFTTTTTTTSTTTTTTT